jgi:high affinity sulfate transporter 1
MSDIRRVAELMLLKYIPAVRWVTEYRSAWLRSDFAAGLTLAAYALPISLAYAELAGLPPQVGVYGYMLGGIGYALMGSSRQLAIGPTSAISLMIAATVAPMAKGDAYRYAQIASLAALMVAAFCFAAWAFRLSGLVKLISDSILVGFKAGAGLTIAITQVPSLVGVSGGGQNFFERAFLLFTRLDNIHYLTLIVGGLAIFLLIIGERTWPARPIALGVVILAIPAAALLGLAAHGVRTTGEIPQGLPMLRAPALRLRDVDGIVPLAAGCMLLAYIESVSAGRSFAAKHGRSFDARQELLGIGAANLAAAFGQSYPVAGGLSQSAVNDKAGARTPLALVFASAALALCLLCLTDVLKDLPKAVLAAIVLTAVAGLVDFRALLRMWRVSRLDFYSACIALCGVLVFGILPGILIATVASILLLLMRVSCPHVAFLGRIPGTGYYSDMARHAENESIPGVLAFRPEGSLIYVNAGFVLDAVLTRLNLDSDHDVRLVICDLSASPFIDLAGSHMLHDLHRIVDQRRMTLRIVGAHGRVRDLLRSDGIDEKVGQLDRTVTLEGLICASIEGPARAG